jgi:diguanylate cyclase (GGDEF)-like protein
VANSDWLVIISIIVLMVDLILGIAIGWWIHEANAARVEAFNAKQAVDALRRLHDLTCEVSGRVGQHLTRIDSVSQELIALRASCSGPKDRAVVDAVSRIVEINEELTGQLTEAKLRLREQAETIEAQAAVAMADIVTGLPNRRGFDDELRRCVAQWQQQETPLSVVLIDVDNLRELQEKHGQAAADDILRGVAQVLNETMRAMDYIARYAEDQFAVMLPGTHLDEAKQAAERIRVAVEARDFRIAETPVRITVSEGVTEAFPGDDAVSLFERTCAALEASREAGRNCGFLHDGSKCEAIPVTSSPGGRGLSLSADDMQALARQLQGLPVDPNTDQLTGLLNRRSFFEGLRHRISEHNLTGSALCLVLVDLDHLKQLNRTHGQLVGDVVLRTVTQIIRTATRAHLDLAARYEEAKIAIVLMHTELEDAIATAERIRRAIAACKLRAEGAEVNVTVSAGIAALPQGGDSVALLKLSEVALKAAKNAGRNCSFYHDGDKARPAVPLASLAPALV